MKIKIKKVKVKKKIVNHDDLKKSVSIILNKHQFLIRFPAQSLFSFQAPGSSATSSQSVVLDWGNMKIITKLY